MRAKTIYSAYIFFLCGFLFLYPISSFGQENVTETKSTSVFIMPLTNHIENYNFSLDRERLLLKNMFESLGFNVVQDESTWEKITEFDYDLVNLSKKILSKISKAVDLDLIVYKNLNRIRVFDCKKKSFIIFEMRQPYTSSQYAVNKLKQMGH